MPTQERQNEAILVELGICASTDALPADDVTHRSPAGKKQYDSLETESTILAAVSKTTPWHQW